MALIHRVQVGFEAILVVVAMAAFGLAAEPGVQAEKPATPMLLGEWQVVSYTTIENRSLDAAIGGTFTFTKDQIQMRKKDRERLPEDDAGYTVDWTKQPIAIDLMPVKHQDLTLEGILKFEGERLTL